jgi:hypothetical protein
MSEFLQLTGIIIRILKRCQAQNHFILKHLAFNTLLCGREMWAIGEQDKSRKTSAEMEFVKRTAKYTR